MLTDNEKVICECGWRGLAADMLRAPNPFDPSDELNGCPHCKQPETLLVACDEPGCWRETSCGTPTPDGYRRTCGQHRPKDAEQRKDSKR